MATNDERHQIIERIVMRPETATADVIMLWQRLGVELVVIIGLNGFNSLYARSIQLVRARYPWLEEGDDPHFKLLKARMDDREPAIAWAAGLTLLTTFTDTLIQLIGEPLASAILKLAWSHNTADTTAKGINDEQ